MLVLAPGLRYRRPARSVHHEVYLLENLIPTSFRPLYRGTDFNHSEEAISSIDAARRWAWLPGAGPPPERCQGPEGNGILMFSRCFIDARGSHVTMFV